MNLDSFKPAWRQFRLLNSMQSLDRDEILLMLDNAEATAIGKTNNILVHTITFILLTLCFQGG